MSGKHSDYAPSSLDRVADCPGSWRVNLLVPSVDSIYSAKGTFGHAVADRCFVEDIDAEELLGYSEVVLVNGVPTEFVVDTRTANAIQSYLDWCRELPGDLYSEKKIDITPWTPSKQQEFGTSDNNVMAPGLLVTTDLKMGEGVKVYAKNLLQGINYALGVYHEWNWAYNFQKVTVRIAQPLLGHFDSHSYTIPELMRWGSYIKQVWNKAAQPDAVFNPTEKACRFCKIKHNCRALAEKTSNEHIGQFDDLTESFEATPLALLSDAELVQVWRMRNLVAGRIKAVADYLRDKTMQGHGPALGLKMVEGRSTSRWRSESDALEAMAAAGIPTAQQRTEALLSPAQASDKVKGRGAGQRRKIIATAVLKPPGKPALAGVEDEREDYDLRHTHAFEEDDEDIYSEEFEGELE